MKIQWIIWLIKDICDLNTVLLWWMGRLWKNWFAIRPGFFFFGLFSFSFAGFEGTVGKAIIIWDVFVLSVNFSFLLLS